MPVNYNYTQDGQVYSFDDVFVPADFFREGNLWMWGFNGQGQLGNNTNINTFTPITTFSGGTNWKQVTSSGNFTAAIKTDGTLWTWGRNASGQLGDNTTISRSIPVTTFAGGTNWKQVACGYFHMAAIKTDGTLWTWGINGNGQLGNNTTTSTLTPITTFAGGTNWKQVSCSDSHTAAIKTDGTLWVWGSNFGGLGLNIISITLSYVPIQPVPDTNWKQIDDLDELETLSCSSFQFTIAIKTDGTLWTWGSNSNGQLGDNTTTDRSTPVTTFAGGTNWKQVSSGQSAAAIKTDGTLWTWGSNYNGQLGDNTTTDRSTPVTTFAGGTNWKQVACGYRHTSAIKTDGTLWTWGRNNVGQLGDNTTTQRNTPVTTILGGTNWKQVACGDNHTAAIKTDGTLWTWGSNYAQLGDNTTINRSTPITTFAGGTNWKQVACGGNFIVAIKTDGTLWTWGVNDRGQLADNTTTNRSTPVTTFAGGTDWKRVAAGRESSAAIKTDGTLWTWGRNSYGQLGDTTVIWRSTPVTTFAGGTDWKQVSIQRTHTAAIKTDGTIWTWGSNAFGQMGVFLENRKITPLTTFAGGTNWKQVACGYQYTLSIKTDGTLWSWGRNNVGQLGDNTTINRSTPVTTFAGGTNWKQVDVERNSIAAIKTDGTLWTWGLNADGQLGDNTTTNRSTPVTTFTGGTNWKQVACGYRHTSAIKTDGTLWSWGRNSEGQLGDFSVVTKITPVSVYTTLKNWKQIAGAYNNTAALTYEDPTI